MEGLTAKVFRTYNASRTLEEQLDLLTKGISLIIVYYCSLCSAVEFSVIVSLLVDDDNVAAKMLSYNRANRAVAVLCNHQRAVPKNFSQQMERLNDKITTKKAELKDAQKGLKDAKQQAKNSGSSTVKRYVQQGK